MSKVALTPEREAEYRRRGWCPRKEFGERLELWIERSVAELVAEGWDEGAARESVAAHLAEMDIIEVDEENGWTRRHGLDLPPLPKARKPKRR